MHSVFQPYCHYQKTEVILDHQNKLSKEDPHQQMPFSLIKYLDYYLS